MKILVLGYFGYVTNQIDGQTIKTRDVYALLKGKCEENINYFDTQSFKLSKLNILKMLWLIIRADKVFYLPAHNNLTYLFPIIFLLSKIFKTKLNYLVVGGWLANFLINKPLHIFMLKNISGIYVETNDLYSKLMKYGFKNLNKLHNFRMVDFPSIDISRSYNNYINMVFMARVHPFKGVEVLFKIEEKLKELKINNFSIDIYGPIFQEYSDQFLSKINNHTNIQYKGIVEPADVYNVMKNYDLTLFPTRYYTEGFPGTILDSYIVGVPVLATNWLNAKEFIDNDITGYIVDFDNPNLFVNKVVDLVKNPNNIYKLRKNIVILRNQYSANKAWEILEKSIYN